MIVQIKMVMLWMRKMETKKKILGCGMGNRAGMECQKVLVILVPGVNRISAIE